MNRHGSLVVIVGVCLMLANGYDEDFRSLLAYLAPHYKVPHRHKLTTKILPRLKDEIETSMKKKMNMIRTLSLSVDSWTNFANEIFIAITAHGITTEWRMERFLLEAIPV